MFNSIDSNEYSLCPEPFRFNCAGYEVKCSTCNACSGNFNKDNLEYSPIDRDKELRFSSHPAYIKNKKDTKDNLRKERETKKSTQLFKDKSKQVRTAIKSERGDLKKLGAKLTIGSGRVNHDGDGWVTLSGIKYYIEYKQRFSDKASIFPTFTEWKKSIREQRASFMIINSPNENTVTMTKEVFLELLSLLDQTLE